MDSKRAFESAHATLDGAIPFPEVARRLIETEVEVASGRSRGLPLALKPLRDSKAECLRSWRRRSNHDQASGCPRVYGERRWNLARSTVQSVSAWTVRAANWRRVR